ncbi:hypothetical protein BIV25_31885 [Streptomyces sp. MUSC 14]|uniref:nuclear transport factor 2 family protein n=1 Tax=Streptomyces sp. MUSC 14 TaxID=1354889 RepID=UPI0008F5DDF0|nr:nuclear transport factor 2 family protein [Streptomyces sp. MUSC 14]OIJ90611.1 hypothetical protein BIV25_31885 [Streptomyces sp. MUSC 14]
MTEDAIARFLRTSQAGDIEAAVDCFADDGVWITPDGSEPGTTYRKNEIGDLIVKLNGLHEQLLAQDIDGRFEDPVPFGDGEYLVRWTLQSGDGKVHARGIDLFVLRDDRIVVKDVYRKA